MTWIFQFHTDRIWPKVTNRVYINVNCWFGQICSSSIYKGICEVGTWGPGSLVPRTTVNGRCWISLAHSNCLYRNDIMNSIYPSSNLNSYHYLAILASWIFLKVEIVGPCPRWGSGICLFSKLSQLFGGTANSWFYAGLKEIRRLPWCRWHGALWLTEEPRTSRSFYVGAQAGKNSCELIWMNRLW